jgi:hypothetical protein
MDDDRFDNLTKRLATGTSRRTALKALAAGAIGAFVSATRGNDAAAKRSCTSNADCSKDPVAGQICLGGECCSKARRCNGDTVCCDQGQYCTEQGCCPRNDVCHDAGNNYCCGPCHSCEGGVCQPCGRCEDCVHGKCTKNKDKCRACRDGGGGPAATSSKSAATRTVDCGPCETCDLDLGCVPKPCDLCSPVTLQLANVSPNRAQRANSATRRPARARL